MMVKGWTYGAEHELADWPRSRSLPKGYGIDVRDHSMVNSNGIAVDPTGKEYGFGGEINTPPTDTIEGQVSCLTQIKELLPEATVNYRSNLHIHIRVPGLSYNLRNLKRIQSYIHKNMPKLFAIVQEIPKPTREEFETDLEFNGALKRWKRRKISHQTLLPQKRLEDQLMAKTIDEFFSLEAPKTADGKPAFFLQPRVCVNLRQLLQTNTIEFRHFAGTLNEQEMLASLCWCRDFLVAAFEDLPTEFFSINYKLSDFPKFQPYIHWMEEIYKKTTHDGSIKASTRRENLREILGDN